MNRTDGNWKADTHYKPRAGCDFAARTLDKPITVRASFGERVWQCFGGVDAPVTVTAVIVLIYLFASYPWGQP